MLNQCCRDLRRIFWAMNKHTKNTRGKTSLGKNVPDRPPSARTEFGTFEDDAATSSQGVKN
jgi:hypothetical protein